MKIKSIKIENYKILKNFYVEFLDKENNILDLVVLAGINGSGKTTILDFISQKYETIYLKAEEKNSDLKVAIKKYIKKKIFKEMISPEKTYKQINDFIESVFENFPKFKGLDEDENIYFINEFNEEILIDELSTGEKGVLEKVIYFFIADIKDSIVLIDEPELSLHPSWQNKLIKIYQNIAQNYNNQIIIATHSPNIIASTPNDSLFVLNKENKKINIQKYNSYGKDINGVVSEIMGSSIRDIEVEKNLKEIKRLIFENNFDEAKTKIDNLEINDTIEIGLLKLELRKRIAKSS